MIHPPHPPEFGGVLGAYMHIRIIERVGQDG
jgi:hypothetical protein